MRLFSLIFIFLLLSVSGFSQNYIPYYNLINEAEFDIYNEEFEAALEKINKAFELAEPLAKDCYLLAFCLDNIDAEANRLEIVRWLLEGSIKPGFTMRWFNTTPLQNDFDEPFILSLWDNIANTQSELKLITDTLNYFIARPSELSQLFADSISIFYDSDHEIFQEHLALLNRHDSIMQAEFLTLVKENGYPGFNISGTSIASVLLRNMSEPLFEEYKVVLLGALKRGQIEPYYYGTMVDVNGCFLKNESFYHSVGVNKPCLPNPEEVAENRRSIGMSLHFRGSRQYLWIEERWLLEISE